MKKQELRNELKAKRNSMSKKEVEEYSFIITKKLISYLKIINTNKIFIYNSFNNEVSTKELIKYLLENEKELYLPKVEGDIMNAIKLDKTTLFQISSFNRLEPVGIPSNIDNFICIIPLIGVDKNGNRIGYGKGYYDKFLKDKRCIKIGICYDFQICEELIDSDIYDIPLDIIISEKRTIEVK